MFYASTTGSRLFTSGSLQRLPTSSASTILQDISSSKGVAKVILKKGKTQLFRDGGSPMVYSGAVDRIIGRPPPKTGDVVLVADGTQTPFAWGFYNSSSMFCVRLMMQLKHESSDPLNVEKLLDTRINAAIKLRNNLGLPSSTTNAFRLVNSEGDRLSGLIIDVFGDLAVVASSAAWVEKYKEYIINCISRFTVIKNVVWRPSIEILKEEGLDLALVDQQQKDDLSTSTNQTVKIVENGISYMISLDGQKTGFYADQRENRQFLSTISHGQTVLDMCCYTGGFALNAARGHALDVTGVDSSSPALELANQNIALNNLDPGRISFLKQDATAFMKNAASRNEAWDIVILDPPKLAPRRKVLQSASGMYRNLNSLAMRLTKPGGFLMTCSCSGAMTQSGQFLPVLQGAASMAGRKITLVRQSGAACDHPIDPSYPEGAYLSNFLLRVV
ncbi:S-adenosyl-L-methionine-dependent methyltransferases superfamily protein [Artemisia annua]|uniref:S-adenosyl-L-methionine-dependent methyltransferases superfamily protein n=1 Tax=Artemisia annua TaxID=35608 RepID=A0A2U1M498_ARTAN|nr:S-adenosyl-L-methionine-dependent methyltransferases superfamily protein [Artemisia annua]